MKLARVRTDKGVREGEYLGGDTTDGNGGTVTTDDGTTYRVGGDAEVLALADSLVCPDACQFHRQAFALTGFT